MVMAMMSVMSVMSVVAMMFRMPAMPMKTMMLLLVVLVVEVSVVSIAVMAVNTVMLVMLALPELVGIREVIDSGEFLIQFRFRDCIIATITLGIGEARCQGDRRSQGNDKALHFHVGCVRYRVVMTIGEGVLVSCKGLRYQKDGEERLDEE